MGAVNTADRTALATLGCVHINLSLLHGLSTSVADKEHHGRPDSGALFGGYGFPRKVQQLSNKHLARKEEITLLTHAELNVQRKSLSKEVLRWEILALKHDSAPGIGCLRKEHLIAIIMNPK